MPWYPRSLADRDTHHGEYSTATQFVHARCGIEFMPLTLADGAPLALPGDPPDPDQVCPQCHHGKPTS